MTNIAKILTVAATLTVGTGAISGMALASGSGIPAPYRLGNHVDGPSVSVPSSNEGSGIPAPWRVGNHADEPSLSLFRSPGAASGIPGPYRLGN
ncbi:MAG: hypothetical protein ACRECX_02250 [Methyloceanibacter sp.]|uniref:hypothetical protein n=1 Tax=Methyloceanibacter sp. TaxID=1965321 RepID=UPI003D6C95E7